METEVILAGGARTPFGRFGGSLKEVSLTDLGAHAASATLDRTGAKSRDVDHIVFGSVLGIERDSVFAPRVIGQRVGLPDSAGALSVNRACGSGLQAIISAGQQIAGGQSSIALACGGENFSRAPHALTGLRWGVKRGAQEIEDTLDWVYRCPLSDGYMGETAERLADEFNYTRADMDDWAHMSQLRAAQAIASGFLSRQIAPIGIPGPRELWLFDTDESPRGEIGREALDALPPVFRPQGRVTAGNSSGVTDGGACLLVAEAGAARRLGVMPEARLVDWNVVGVPPRIMGCGPVPAISGLLEIHDLAPDDIDYFEVNEAFAVVNLHAERQLGIARERTNLYGGGVSLGHPPGATGIRMTITAMHHLADTGGRLAVISMCMGAGQGMAMLIENRVAAPDRG